MDSIRAFFPKSGHFFWFLQKRQWRFPPSPLLRASECDWICINIPEYPQISLKLLEQPVLTMSGLWICLIILHVSQAFEDAQGLKYVRFFNMALLYMQALHKVLSMSEHGSICMNVSLCLNALNMPEHNWIVLNVLQYAWKCQIKPFFFYHNPHYTDI